MIFQFVSVKIAVAEMRSCECNLERSILQCFGAFGLLNKKVLFWFKKTFIYFVTSCHKVNLNKAFWTSFVLFSCESFCT